LLSRALSSGQTIADFDRGPSRGANACYASEAVVRYWQVPLETDAVDDATGVDFDPFSTD